MIFGLRISIKIGLFWILLLYHFFCMPTTNVISSSGLKEISDDELSPFSFSRSKRSKAKQKPHMRIKSKPNNEIPLIIDTTSITKQKSTTKYLNPVKGQDWKKAVDLTTFEAKHSLLAGENYKIKDLTSFPKYLKKSDELYLETMTLDSKKKPMRVYGDREVHSLILTNERGRGTGPFTTSIHRPATDLSKDMLNVLENEYTTHGKFVEGKILKTDGAYDTIEYTIKTPKGAKVRKSLKELSYDAKVSTSPAQIEFSVYLDANDQKLKLHWESSNSKNIQYSEVKETFSVPNPCFSNAGRRRKRFALCSRSNRQSTPSVQKMARKKFNSPTAFELPPGPSKALTVRNAGEIVQGFRNGKLLKTLKIAKGMSTKVLIGAKTFKVFIIKFGSALGTKIKYGFKKYIKGGSYLSYPLMVRDIAAAIRRGDKTALAMMGTMTGLQLATPILKKLGKVGTAAGFLKSAKILTSSSKWLGRALSGVGLFFDGMSLFNSASCLVQQNKNKALCVAGSVECQDEADICEGRNALVSVIVDSVSLVLNVIGLVCTPCAPFTALFSIFLNIFNELYQAEYKVNQFRKYIPLTDEEAAEQKWRILSGQGFSPALELAKARKKANTPLLLEHMTSFLKENSKSFTRYVIPAYDVKDEKRLRFNRGECEWQYRDKMKGYKDRRVALGILTLGISEAIVSKPNLEEICRETVTVKVPFFFLHGVFVDLRAKETVRLDRWAPDWERRSGYDYICPPSTLDPNIPHRPVTAYQCRHAQALEINGGPKSLNMTYVNMNTSSATVYGSQNYINYFAVDSRGGKAFRGGDKNDVFQVVLHFASTEGISTLDGVDGEDTLDITKDSTPFKMPQYIPIEIEPLTGDEKLAKLSYGGYARIYFQRIEIIYGRPGIPDVIELGCWNSFVDGRGDGDQLGIKQRTCLYNLTVNVNGSTHVSNGGGGQFVYVLHTISTSNPRNVTFYLNKPDDIFANQTSHLFFLQFPAISVVKVERIENNEITDGANTFNRTMFRLTTMGDHYHFSFEQGLNPSVVTNDQAVLDYAQFDQPLFVFNNNRNNNSVIRGAKTVANLFLISDPYTRNQIMLGGDLFNKFILSGEGWAESLAGGNGLSTLEFQSSILQSASGSLKINLMEGQVEKSDESNETMILKVVNITHVVTQINPNNSVETTMGCRTKFMDVYINHSSAVDPEVNSSTATILHRLPPELDDCSPRVHITVVLHEGQSRTTILNGASSGDFQYQIRIAKVFANYEIHVVGNKSNSNFSTTHRFELDLLLADIVDISPEVTADKFQIALESVNGTLTRFSMVDYSSYEAMLEDYQERKLRASDHFADNVVEPEYEDVESDFEDNDEIWNLTLNLTQEEEEEIVDSEPAPKNHNLEMVLMTADNYEIHMNGFGGIHTVHKVGLEQNKRSGRSVPGITPDEEIEDIIVRHQGKANDLGITLLITLVRQDAVHAVIIIGGDDNTDVFQNDPNVESHLVGNIGCDENIFKISTATTPAAVVNIYVQDLDNPTMGQVNILDLTDFYTPQLEELGLEFNDLVFPVVVQSGNDLEIRIPGQEPLIIFRDGVSQPQDLKIKLYVLIYNFERSKEGRIWSLVSNTPDLTSAENQIVILSASDLREIAADEIAALSLLVPSLSNQRESIFHMGKDLVLTNTLQDDEPDREKVMTLVILNAKDEMEKNELEIKVEFTNGQEWLVSNESFQELEDAIIAYDRVELQRWTVWVLYSCLILMSAVFSLTLIVCVVLKFQKNEKFPLLFGPNCPKKVRKRLMCKRTGDLYESSSYLDPDLRSVLELKTLTCKKTGNLCKRSAYLENDLRSVLALKSVMCKKTEDLYESSVYLDSDLRSVLELKYPVKV